MARKRKLVRELTRAEFIRRYVWPRARAVLRFWPPALEAFKACELEPPKKGYKGLYHCKGCGTINMGHFMQRDHITPIGSLKGVSWDEAFNRLFCEKENFQILCVQCHKKKTNDNRA